MPVLSTLRLSCSPVVALAALGACAPQITDDGNQCHDANYELTRVIDTPRTGSWPAVDGLAEAYVAWLAANPNDARQVGGGSDRPRCAVAVIRDAQVAYVSAYPNTGAAADGIDTVWPLGSIAKPITALALFTMLEDGLISSLDDLAGDHYPWLHVMKPDYAALSLRQLLSHTSGLPHAHVFPSQHQLPSEQAELMAASFGVIEMQAHTDVADVPPVPAGTVGPFRVPSGQYSNPGYSLLGAVVERRARLRGEAERYEDAVWKRVALNRNAVGPIGALSLCLGAEVRAQGDIPNLSPDAVQTWNGNRNWGFEGPSGGWTAMIGDVARLALMLQGNHRIRESLSQRMQTIHVDDVEGRLYALGLMRQPYAGPAPAHAMGHSGQIDGHTAEFAIRLDGAHGLAMACNRQIGLRRSAPSDPEADDIFMQIANAAANDPVGPSLTPMAEQAAHVQLAHRHGAALARMIVPLLDDGRDLRVTGPAALLLLGGGPPLLDLWERRDLDTLARRLVALLPDEGHPEEILGPWIDTVTPDQRP